MKAKTLHLLSIYLFLKVSITTPILEEKNFTQHGNENRNGKNLGTRTIKFITALYVKHT
jgi:hypothetical protein